MDGPFAVVENEVVAVALQVAALAMEAEFDACIDDSLAKEEGVVVEQHDYLEALPMVQAKILELMVRWALDALMAVLLA